MSMQPAEIATALAEFVVASYPSAFSIDTLPRDRSLLEAGILDSAGVIELVVFAESTWGIEISDDDITRERMGSLNKMAALVDEYLARRA